MSLRSLVAERRKVEWRNVGIETGEASQHVISRGHYTSTASASNIRALARLVYDMPILSRLCGVSQLHAEAKAAGVGIANMIHTAFHRTSHRKQFGLPSMQSDLSQEKFTAN